MTVLPVTLVVFTRAPVPGKVKTRLAAAIGDWRAARLQDRLSRRTIETARRAGCARVELHVTPRARHPLTRRWPCPPVVAFRGQRGADLGTRMANAIGQAMRKRRPVVLFGSDCPVLKVRDLRRAARALLAGRDAVLAPVEDGGYVLIGLRRPMPALFEGPLWGSGGVLQATQSRLAREGRSCRVLPTLWDVDELPDLARLSTRGAWWGPRSM